MDMFYYINQYIDPLLLRCLAHYFFSLLFFSFFFFFFLCGARGLRIGFGASLVFGTLAGGMADMLGRKKICILFSLAYTGSCTTDVPRHSRVLNILGCAPYQCLCRVALAKGCTLIYADVCNADDVVLHLQASRRCGTTTTS